MKASLMIFTALLAAGCAAASPYTGDADGEYRLEIGRIEAHERFQRLTRTCGLAGGVVRIDRQTSGRFPLTTLEMRSATCEPYPGPAQVW